ncbi:MAG TPA: hypothetical protein VGJ89_01165 [Geothrix sp.]
MLRTLKQFTWLLLCATLSITLRAQLDPRLQGAATSSDLLDVYRTGGARPEMLTLFDFSGSMHAIYWHPKYYTSSGQNSHLNQFTNFTPGQQAGDFPGVVPIMDINGRVFMVEGTGYAKDLNTTSQPMQFGLAGGDLVRPDGTVIAINHALTYTQDQLRSYVLQASHLRVTATAIVLVGGVTQSVSRTLDLPIPWAIFDQVSNTSASNIITKINDPSLRGPSVDPDWLHNTPSNVLNDLYLNRYKIGRFHYNKDYLWWLFFGTDTRNATNDGSVDTGRFVVPAVATTVSNAEPSGFLVSSTAWSNLIPSLTRFQALKSIVIKAWFENQDKVWWGYRYLDDSEQNTTTLSNLQGPWNDYIAINRNLRFFRCAPDINTPDDSVRYLALASPSTSTPLTYGLANTYAQLIIADADTTSVFRPGGQSTGIQCGQGELGTDTIVPPCRKTFVVVFTDGLANDNYDKSKPNGDAIGHAKDLYTYGSDANVTGYGNLEMAKHTSELSPAVSSSTTGYFNIWTLSAIAAHYPTPIKGVLSDFAPFIITNRGATPANPRRIKTMSVGMSLAGNLTDPTSGKADLFRVALYGDPAITSWSLNTKPYDPFSSDANDPGFNPFYFDATDPAKLSNALTAILSEVVQASGSISAPASPQVGLSLGRQVYLGLFQTAKLGPAWTGDLLMAGIKVGSTGVTFVDNTGAPTTTITGGASGNATWSAGAMLKGSKTWQYGKSNSRRVYTTLGLNSKDLVELNENNAAITMAMVGAVDAASRQAYIRFLRGASRDAETDATIPTMRNDALGDIINSAPAILSYPPELVDSGTSDLLKAGKANLLLQGVKDLAFREIFVADNQGYLHAFGEVSGTKDIKLLDGTTSFVPLGVVDELWTIIPYQHLKAAPYLRSRSNPHRYLFDGSPIVYFKDVPASGRTVGNGLVDGNDITRVIVGEGKGGRSYFAVDVKNPFFPSQDLVSPKLAWQIVPDDTSLDPTIQRMGFSTSVPAIGQVETGSGGFSSLRDLVFLGGGLSTAEVDSNFIATYGTGTKLGRSILAVDAANGPDAIGGGYLRVWNLLGADLSVVGGEPNIGSISAGVVPLRFFPNNQKVQRIYFIDQPTIGTRGSALWALGSLYKTPTGIRLDNSNVDAWTTSGAPGGLWGFRRIFQADPGTVTSSLPAPFRLAGSYPVSRTVTPFIAPAAVGVAFNSGDRNDPMDLNLINPAPGLAAGFNTFNLVFDRQDSAALSSNTPSASNVDTAGFKLANLTDLTNVASFLDPRIDPVNTSYYLKNSFGYYLKLGSAVAKAASNPNPGGSMFFYPKTVTTPLVLSGVGFFSSFTGKDTGFACSGGGDSRTYRLCDIINPIFNNGTAISDPNVFNPSQVGCSGIVMSFTNIPGEITALGTSAAIQTGQGKSSSGAGGLISNSGAQGGGALGNPGSRGFRPRSWRIIR